MNIRILKRIAIAAVAAWLGWSGAAAADDEQTREVHVVVSDDAAAPQAQRHTVVLGHGFDDEGKMDGEPRTFLGVETARASSTLREQLGLPRGIGLVVQRVVGDTPAAAVLKQHDILTKLDDQLLVSSDQLGILVRSKNPGDEVTLTFVRGGREQTATVKLGEKKGGAARVFGFHTPNVEMNGLDEKMGELHQRLRGLHGDISTAEVSRMLDAVRVEGAHDGRVVASLHRGDSPVRRMLNVARGNVVFSDDDGVVELRNDGAEQHLLVKDAQGKVVFDGPVGTDEQRAALSEDVKARLRKVENIQRIETVPGEHLEREQLRVLGGGEESAAVKAAIGKILREVAGREEC